MVRIKTIVLIWWSRGESICIFISEEMKIKERLRQAVAGGAHSRRIYMGSIPLN